MVFLIFSSFVLNYLDNLHFPHVPYSHTVIIANCGQPVWIIWIDLASLYLTCVGNLCLKKRLTLSQVIYNYLAIFQLQ